MNGMKSLEPPLLFMLVRSEKSSYLFITILCILFAIEVHLGMFFYIILIMGLLFNNKQI